jgi:RNA polymerase sigma factor (sigma-70 family)
MKSFIPNYNEKELLLKVAEADEAAFRELYLHWQPLLATFILRITKSRESTAEIIQDVFLKIWLTREALNEVENFKSYLFIISRNHALNAFQKSMREVKRIDQLGRSISRESNEIDENKLVHLTLVDEAIDHLTERRKQVYLLHRHQKLTYIQIGDQLGISRESVKTHLELAIKSITQYLKDRMSTLILVIGFFSTK